MSERGRTESGFEWLLAVASRRTWLAVAVFAGVLAGVGSLIKFLPDIYQSTATVLVERHHVPETFVRSSITGELETRLHTISQEVLSRARLGDLITRFDLYADLRKKAPLENAIQTMRRALDIELKSTEQMSGRRATIAFTLSYRGRDPETVARVTNTLASLYVQENVKLREQQATGTAEFLRLQVAQMTKQLAQQEERIRNFRARHTGELPQQMTVNLATLERLYTQLHLNSANYLRATDRRAAVAKQLAEADPTGAAGAPDTMATRIAKLRHELLELRQRFSDQYPDVRRLKAELAALERDLAEPDTRPETDRAASADPSVLRLKAALREADAEIDILKTEEQRLRRDIRTYQQRVENAPQREQEFQELARDYETARELYASMRKRYEDAQLAESMEQRQQGEQFRILDSAIPATQPAAPNRFRLFLMALMVSLGAATAAVVLAEHVDTSFHTIHDLKALSPVPVLVSIPLIVTDGDRRQRKWRFVVTAAAITLALALVIKASQYIADGNEVLVRLLARGGV